MQNVFPFDSYSTITIVRICFLNGKTVMTNAMIGINNELFCSKSSQTMNFKLKLSKTTSITKTIFTRNTQNNKGKLINPRPSIRSSPVRWITVGDSRFGPWSHCNQRSVYPWFLSRDRTKLHGTIGETALHRSRKHCY